MLENSTIGFALIFLTTFCIPSAVFSAPKYEQFACPVGWSPSPTGPHGRPLFTTRGSELDKNLSLSFINQLCAPERESQTCYSNVSHQILQTHLFVTQRKQLKDRLRREPTAEEETRLKEDLKLMPLYTWLQGNREHRSKPYAGVSFQHLQNIRNYLSLMKEPKIPELELGSGVVLAGHFFGYNALAGEGENPYSGVPSFGECVDRAKRWFGDHVLAASEAKNIRAMYDIMNSYLLAEPSLKAEFQNYNVYGYESVDLDKVSRPYSTVAEKVRTVLSNSPHYPLAFGTSGHYITITGIEEECCKNNERDEFKCEDQWQVKNSYGEEHSGLYSSNALFEGFQNLVYIKPCGKSGEESCKPEIQEISNPLKWLLEQDHIPAVTIEDFDRLGSAKLVELDEYGNSPLITAIYTGKIEFVKAVLRYLISRNLLDQVAHVKTKKYGFKPDGDGTQYGLIDSDETIGSLIEKAITSEVDLELHRLIHESNTKH